MRSQPLGQDGRNKDILFAVHLRRRRFDSLDRFLATPIVGDSLLDTGICGGIFVNKK